MTLDPVRFSRLKLMARSPLHYAAASVEETLAMEKGSAVHSLVLGGHPVIGWEDGRPRRGKDFDAFVADNPGALILTAKAFDEAKCIADAVRSNRLAMAALDGEHEATRAWKFNGRACQGHIDSLPRGGVTELKVSMTADPDRFVWHALRMGWLPQCVWYSDGLATLGDVRDNLQIVAVESKPPFAVTVFRLSQKTVDQARRTYRAWFERLLVCEASDSWPPYAQAVVELDVPDNDVALDFGDAEAA